MRNIVQELTEAQVIDTDNDSGPDELPEPSNNALSIPIQDLFDFTQSYWVEAYDKLAMRGLQDECDVQPHVRLGVGKARPMKR